MIINSICFLFTVVLREQLAIKVDLKEERVEVSFPVEIILFTESSLKSQKAKDLRLTFH